MENKLENIIEEVQLGLGEKNGLDFQDWCKQHQETLTALWPRLSQQPRISPNRVLWTLWMREKERGPASADAFKRRAEAWLQGINGLYPREAAAITLYEAGYNLPPNYHPCSIQDKKLGRWADYKVSRSRLAEFLMASAIDRRTEQYLGRWYNKLALITPPETTPAQHGWMLNGFGKIYQTAPAQHVLVVHNIQLTEYRDPVPVNRFAMATLAAELASAELHEIPVQHVFYANTEMRYDQPNYGTTVFYHYTPGQLLDISGDVLSVGDRFWTSAIENGERWSRPAVEKRPLPDEQAIVAAELVKKMGQLRAIEDVAKEQYEKFEEKLKTILYMNGGDLSDLTLGKDSPLSPFTRKAVNGPYLDNILETNPDLKKLVCVPGKKLDMSLVEKALQENPELEKLLNEAAGQNIRPQCVDTDKLLPLLSEGQRENVFEIRTYFAKGRSAKSKENFAECVKTAKELVETIIPPQQTGPGENDTQDTGDSASFF